MSRRGRRTAKAPPPGAGAASATRAAPVDRPGARPPPAAAGGWLARACLLSPLAALAALAWSLRGAPLGTPVADDFEFLRRLQLPGPPGLLDSMGATYYWRPLSRQVWFTLMAPLLSAAPWAVAVIHVAILALTAGLLARIARRVVPWPAAALVAAAVIASEPARVLVAWPSGSQHLLAALGIVLTTHEVLSGRRWTAALAACGAALSHDLGALAFVVLGAGGLLRREGRRAWMDAALAAVLAALWLAGYRAALAHGVQLPAGGLAKLAGAWPAALRLGLKAGVNVETLPALYAGPLRAVTAILFVLAIALLVRSALANRERAATAMVAASLLIALLGFAALAPLLPDWNAWRAWVPVVALAFAMSLAAARAHLALGLALVALRVAALAGAEPARRVTGDPPPAVSDLSFARLARMQKVVAATGPLVRAAPHGRNWKVVYLGLPEMATNGFRRDAAVQVWSRDTSTRFIAYENDGVAFDSTDLAISYDTRPGRRLAFPLSVEARRDWRLGIAAMSRNDESGARDLFARALAAQQPESPSMVANVLLNLAIRDVARGELRSADSLSRRMYEVRGTTPEQLALDALIAISRGRLDQGRQLVGMSLRMNPNGTLGRSALSFLEQAETGKGAGAAAPR